MRKLKSTIVYLVVILMGFTACKKEEEEPIANELEIKESKLCQSWRREYLIINGDTSASGPFIFDMEFKETKDYILTITEIGETGEEDEIHLKYSHWDWSENYNSIITQSTSNESVWYLYSIILLPYIRKLLSITSLKAHHY